MVEKPRNIHEMVANAQRNRNKTSDRERFRKGKEGLRGKRKA